ncbi:hypothetical protein NAP1_01200 [Erythrobacter sp. NAP1]|uniref:hypothetical protein n=1 Tax=Erythrobacter sp. NAP1 TaxID=237727 RepID=UPI0000686AA4|nr:hypothetical protein [Erythrobacter sp. NAP1]EAQ29346.1 hypothetical protein NAP1_01200 [Erythrobacter sp. NAP1]
MQAILSRRDETGGAMPWHMLAVGILVLVWSMMVFAKYGALGTASGEISGWTQVYVAACVWGSFAGAILLLARSRWAVQAFVTGIVGIMAASFTMIVLNSPAGNIYHMPALFGLWVITQTALLYALRVRSRGLLR